MILESADVRAFLDSLARTVARSLSAGGSEVFCGVTLLRARRKTTVASSDMRARQLDEAQLGYDDGPCLRAAREGITFHLPDTEHDNRFPGYHSAMAGSGIRSILAVPIPLEGDAKAALNLYCTWPNAFDSAAVGQAEGFARDASESLLLAVRVAALVERNADLKAAMESRTTIDMAVGIIMGQNRCSQTDAFEILRKASAARNVKLRDVAAGVVASVTGDAITTHFDE
jgi:GAF domain-containing protein